MKSRIAKLLVGAAFGVTSSFMAIPMLAGPASALSLPAACPSYGPCATVTVVLNKSTVPPGGSVTVTIEAAPAGRTFTITIFSTPTTLGTITTNSSGTGSATVTIPLNESLGQHTITVSDPQGDSGSATLTVAAASTTNKLPITGTDEAALAGIGACAIGAGGILVLGARRRRSVRASAAK